MFFNKRFSAVLCATVLVLVITLLVVACQPAPAPTTAPVAAATTAPVATAAPKPTDAPKPTVPPTAVPAKDPYKGITSAQDAWAKAAELGPYAPKTQDWVAIEAAAKKEGKVVVYSFSSRVAQFTKAFEAVYPGIKTEGFDISTMELLTKLTAEQKAGIYNADVILVNDTPTLFNEMLYPPNKLFWNFVPDPLLDNAKADAVLDQPAREPLFVHHHSFNVWIYNTEVYKEPPIKNIWDVTKPEWKGKIVMGDPQKSAPNLNALVVYTDGHADEFAKAYEAAFGKPIKLDPGIPDAAYQWIKNLAMNEPALTPTSDDCAKAVGTLGQKDPPIGRCSYGQIRNVIAGTYKWDVMWGMQPVIGATEDTIMAVANQAPHPNAAKLMLRWMAGDEKGGKGFAPYFLPGEPSPRKDMAAVPGAKPLSDLLKVAWRSDSTFTYLNAVKVRDFWIANLKK